jgi:hypothetical protein
VSGYPVPDNNRTRINDATNSNLPTKTPSKKKSWKKSLIISWRKSQTWLTKMFKMHSRNIKSPKIKNRRRHRNK